MLFNSNFWILAHGPSSESPEVLLKVGDSRASCTTIESESLGNEPENWHFKQALWFFYVDAVCESTCKEAELKWNDVPLPAWDSNIPFLFNWRNCGAMLNWY